jgi:hypothetical protein
MILQALLPEYFAIKQRYLTGFGFLANSYTLLYETSVITPLLEKIANRNC